MIVINSLLFLGDNFRFDLRIFNEGFIFKEWKRIKDLQTKTETFQQQNEC